MLHVESESHIKNYVDHDRTAREVIIYVKAVDPICSATHHLCGSFYCNVYADQLDIAAKLSTAVEALNVWRE